MAQQAMSFIHSTSGIIRRKTRTGRLALLLNLSHVKTLSRRLPPAGG